MLILAQQLYRTGLQSATEGGTMADKLFFVDDVDLDHLAHQVAPRALDHVGAWCDGGPFEGLLWIEVRRMERKARLTSHQATYLEWHLRGFTYANIADVFSRDESTIRDTVDRALVKIGRCPYRGVLTTMIETLGWPAVREMFADERERNLPKLPKDFVVREGYIGPKSGRKYPG